MTSQKIKSTEIKLALKRAFPSPGWQVFYEVGNDTGSRVSRHADAVAMGIWPSNGHLIHGFEIKVSRGDFLNEMKDPTKAQAVFQFCNRWSLVTPVGLVKVDELPEPWGLMTFDGKTLRTVKQAPALTPVPLTPGFVAAMLRRAGEADEKLIQAAVHDERARAYEERQKAVREAVESDRRNRISSAERNADELAKYRNLFAGMSTYDVEALAPYVKIAKMLGTPEGYNQLRVALTTIEKVGADLRRSFDELDEFNGML